MSPTRLLRNLLCIVPALASGPAFATEILHRPLDTEPGTLDPQKMSSADWIAVDRDLFVGLLTLDPEGKPVPAVAESWTVSPDGKRWTFHLRPDAKWSNGDALTSADFVYAFRRLVDPATAADDPSDLKQVVNAEEIIAGKEKDLSKLGVTAPDAHTLELMLKEPRAALPFLLTDPQLFPLNRASLEKWGKDWTQPGHMVSNAAYTLTGWTPQADITLTKNPYFWDAADVAIDEVHWLNASDRDAALRRYRGGELDYVAIDRNHIAWVKQNMADVLHTAPVNQISFFFINMTKGPLSQDVRLREALNLATDRETLVNKIDPRGQLPAYGVEPPVVSDYTEQTMPFKDTSMADRIAKAQALMTAAGYGPDHHLALTFSYPTQESTKQILLAVQQMWRKIWVDLTLDNSEWQVFVSLVNNRNYEIGVMSGSSAYNDYENGLDNYRSDAGTFNWSGYSNATFDGLFHRGATATDMATRRHLMEQAEAVVLADYPLVPLYYNALNRVVNPKLVGLADSVLYPQSRYLSLKP
jgi:oligopeptide transport system substrate-binding protein